MRCHPSNLPLPGLLDGENQSWLVRGLSLVCKPQRARRGVHAMAESVADIVDGLLQFPVRSMLTRRVHAPPKYLVAK